MAPDKLSASFYRSTRHRNQTRERDRYAAWPTPLSSRILLHWPVPVKLTTICTEAPWLITSLPALVPVAVGLKTTATEQLVFGARDVPHVFVWLKSPLIVMPSIRLDAVPVALRV